MKENIKKVIVEYIEEHPTLNATKLADRIMEDNAITGKSHRTIRGFIGEVKEATEITTELTADSEGNVRIRTFVERGPSDEEINEELNCDIIEEISGEIGTPYQETLKAAIEAGENEDEDLPTDELIEDEDEDIEDENFDEVSVLKSIYDQISSETMSTDQFEVEDLVYKISVGKNDYNYSVQLVDRVFCAYSRKGLNLTKTQIMSNMRLDVNNLNALMTKLNLTKDSEPFGPFTDEFMEKEDIYAVTVDNASSLLDVVKETDSAALEALVRAYKKAYVEFSNKNLKHDAFLKDVVANVKNLTVAKPVIPVTTGVTYRHETEFLTAIITDLHLGLNLPIFNYEIARTKLDEIAGDINAMGAKNVCISFLGDTIHTFSGVNHANMWKTIEPGAWGANSVTKPFELLLEFCGKINNLVTVMSVSGNHDRAMADKELEESNEAAKLLFYMLKFALPSVDVIHTNHKTVLDRGNIVFINLHGDQGLDKKSADKIAWKLGSQEKFNMILEGHFHSRILSKDDDTAGYRKMHCPAFAPTDDYADRLGLGSLSGWLMIVERNGLPMVIDTPINYGSKAR